MGIRRVKKPRSRQVDAVPTINMSEQPAAPPKEAARSNVYGEELCDQFAQLDMKLRKITEESLPELDTDCGSAIASFEDFWDDGGEAGAATSSAAGAQRGDHRIATPNQSPKQSPKLRAAVPPLKHFKVGTPPGSPRGEEKSQEKRGYVPPWPYGSKWPFNCAPTTLELRSLPKGCTAEVIIHQLDSWGLANKCNLIYVASTGVAIVNASRHSDGCAVASRLHNFSDWKVQGVKVGHTNHKKKTCRVAWSFTSQGLDALVMAYHQDYDACAYNSQGMYVGPWILHGNAWMALFSPMHLWPVAYVADWSGEQDPIAFQRW